MRIALIGPAHPWRGGIPLHTAELAHRLAAVGHDVRICSWRSQGPARWLPTQRDRLATPEAPPYPASTYPLDWRSPLSWWWVGRRLARQSDVVVLVSYTTVQAPALGLVGAVARRGARVIALCHNVLPHERHPADRWLTTLLLRTTDAVLVHSNQQHATLTALTDRPATVAALPPHLPTTGPRTEPRTAAHGLVFFGTIRHYKGLDVLLHALARVPGVRLSVVGEFRDGSDSVRELIARLGLTDRVTIRPGYLPAGQIADLFATADAVVLPYRAATASQHVALAHEHGVPVIATRVGNFPDMVSDGVDGLLCEPDDVDDLARAIQRLYQPGQLTALRAAVLPADTEARWREYLGTLFGLLTPPATRSQRYRRQRCA
ncbi:MAG TPA: glycosyltransferase [Pseudonocardiaceae bacterium]|jgi:glycosyltransferase involved in cell wall biosynthesis